MKKSIMPYAANFYASKGLKKLKRQFWQTKRQLLRQPHQLEVFIRADDPYSYLLIQVFAAFLKRFKVTARFYPTLKRQQDSYPQPEMWLKNAIIDAAHLAQLYQLDFPLQPQIPSQKNIEVVTAQLLAVQNSDEYLDHATRILRQLWHQQSTEPSAESEKPTLDAYLSQLNANETKLKQLGHYFSAMIFYNGEWYWGLDRLDHLEQRLITLGLAHNPQDTVQFNRTYQPFCHGKPIHPGKQSRPLTIFWSARSPYSYLALMRAHQLTQHYQIPLLIKPVMPMMMRNMVVPESKKMYIFLDTKREAEKLGITYGFVADPLGPAVERCYALLDYARQSSKLTDFLLSFAKGVNAEGIRADTDAGLQLIVERCGLNWSLAQPLLNQQDWRHQVQQNLDEMFALGCWGVPVLCFNDVVCWGQDRLGIIEQAIKSKTL